MKSMILCGLVLALSNSGSHLAEAHADSETRPVVVASFSGYAELKRNLEYLGALSGNPGMAAEFEKRVLPSSQGQGLAGLDQTRSWGAWLNITDEASFHFLVFLPVEDFRKLLDTLDVDVEADEVGDDVYQIKRESHTFFITQRGKWAYVSRKQSALEGLPDDPLQQLRGLDEQYDLALSVNVQNIPMALRGMVAGLIKRGLDARLRTGRNEGDEQSELRAQRAGDKLETLINSVNGLDRLTFGLNIDRSGGRTNLDLELTALADSDLAKRPAADARQAEGPWLAGVFSPNALFSLHLDWPVLEKDQPLVNAWLNGIRDDIPVLIDRIGLYDAQKPKAKKLAGRLLDLIGETIEKKGGINFGLAVTGGPRDEFHDMIAAEVEKHFPNRVRETVIGVGQVGIVAAGLTADGGALEDVAKQAIALAGENVEAKLNVEEYQGRRFHAVSVMAPQTMSAELPLRMWRNILGNPLKIVLAFGEDTFYVAVGQRGADAIKQAIDKSAAAPAEKLPPLTASLALAQAWNLVAAEIRNPAAAKIAQGLRRSGQDHLRFTVEPVARGVRCRIEGEEGISTLLALSLAKAAGMSASFDSSVLKGANRVTTHTSADGTTTTTTQDGGKNNTVTQTETNGKGSRSLRRRVMVTRRGSSANEPSGPRSQLIFPSTEPAAGNPPEEPSSSKAGKKASKGDDKDAGAASQPALRTWSSKTGKYRVEARFVGLEDGLLTLITRDGETLTVALPKLSQEDQKVARQLAEEMEENPFIPKGADD